MGVGGAGVGVGGAGVGVAPIGSLGALDGAGEWMTGADADGAGALDATATTGAASSIVVDRKSGEAMYQPTGSATASAAMSSAPLERGCRRATVAQPRRRAMTIKPTVPTTLRIAIGIRYT